MKLLLVLFLSFTALSFTHGQHVTASLAESVTQTFTQLTQDQIESTTIVQNVLDFGSQEILRFALEAGEIDNANFEVTAVNSVATQNFDTSVFYNCSVHLENGEGLLLNAWFTIFHQEALTISVIVDYNFEVIHNNVTIGELNDIIQLIAPNEDEYTAITVQNDAIAQEALQTGAEEIVQLGVNAQTLTVADFTISQVTQAFSQIIGNGIFYKFSVVLQNSAGQTVTATFEIYYQIYIEETRFVSYAYNLDGSALGDLTYVVPVLTLNGGFTQCSESEIRTSVPLFNDLDFGANTVADRGYVAGHIPGGSYVLYQIYSVEKFNFTLGTAYRYQIVFSNKNSVVVQTNFTVINQTIAQHLSLSSHSYQVSLNGYGTSSSSATNSENDIWVNCTITSDVIIGQKNWNNTNGTNSTKPVKSPGSGYVLLTAAEIQDPIVQACVNYGMNNIIQIGVQLNSFPFSKWNLTEVIAVYQKDQNWGQIYQITLHLTNAKGLKMETTFTLSYNIATLLIRLNTYFYNVGAWISTLTVATTSGLNTTDPNPPLTSNLPYSDSNDGLEYASNGYYKIPLNWIDQSDDIKDCINFGANAVVQVGVNQKKIPISDYLIYDVIWIQRYIGSKGDYYAIKLFLTNADNVDLVVTSTTYIVRATKAISLYTYAYTASNILSTWYTPGGSQTTQNTSTVPTVSNISSLVITASWDALSSAEIQANLEAQEVLQYSTDFITNIAVQANNAPACSYSISTINSVATKSSVRGIYYLVDVVLSSATNVNIATTVTVYIDRSNDGYAVASYKYQVSNDQGTISH